MYAEMVEIFAVDRTGLTTGFWVYIPRLCRDYSLGIFDFWGSSINFILLTDKLYNIFSK